MTSSYQPEKEAKDSKETTEKAGATENIEEGKKAIAAAKISDPKPEQQQEKEDEEDAEQWRNEG